MFRYGPKEIVVYRAFTETIFVVKSIACLEALRFFEKFAELSLGDDNQFSFFHYSFDSSLYHPNSFGQKCRADDKPIALDFVSDKPR